MPYDSSILIETANRVGLIRLNRPQTLFALNSRFLQEMMEALEGFDRDAAIEAMVVSGNDCVFTAVAEIGENSQASAVEMLHSNLIAQFNRIRQIQKPATAAASGLCLGRGASLRYLAT